MARKKSVSNQSARREEIVDYDVKRLRQMSAKELQDYYDRVEPLSDDEVNAIYDRVMPKIAYEIASDNQQKKPRHIGSSIKKTVLVAICMTLMLSVVAQALGIPVWETIVSWTKDTFRIETSNRKATSSLSESFCFSNEEIEIWGDDVCKAFSEIGVFPSLPRYMPNGFEQFDLYYMTDDQGYSCVDVLYKDDSDHFINLVAEIYTSEGYSYAMTVEHDNLNTHDITINDVTYHFASNLKNNTVAWSEQNGSYCISGNIDMSILDAMIQSIAGDF